MKIRTETGAERELEELRRKVEKLEKARNLYTELFDSAGAGLCLAGPDGRVRLHNPAFARVVGAAVEDLTGSPLTDLFVGPSRDELARAVESVRGGGSWSGGADVEGGYVNLVLSPAAGDGVAVVVTAEDAGEDTSSLAEEKVKDQLHFLQTLIDTIPSPIFYKDTDGRYLGCNRAFEETIGIAADDIVGRTVYDVAPENLAHEYHRRDAELLDSSGTQNYEYTVRGADGTTRDVIFNKAAWTRRSDGKVAGLVGVMTDITGHREAEKKHEKQLRRLAALRAVDLTINASLDLRVTFDVILDHVRDQLEVDAADVLLYNKHLHRLEFAASRGFRTRALTHTQLAMGESHAGRAALERRVVHISDLNERRGDFRKSGELDGEGFTSYYGVPLVAKGQVQGVLEIFHRSELEPDKEWLDFLDALAAQAAIAIDNATLFKEMQRSNEELTSAYDVTIEGWSRALDLRDKETEGHSRRVTEMTLELARAVGMDPGELPHVRRGALLHDIGKMGVPDRILLKAGPLDDDEWEVMRRHPDFAFEMLSPIEFLRRALDIPYCHHERWDGTGYPRGLKGGQIPLAARIFSVVDVFDAMTSDRPYRKAWPVEKVVDHLKDLSGSHFDPGVVATFLELIPGFVNSWGR